MTWIGYRENKLSLIDKIVHFVKGYGWLKVKTEFKLVSVMNASDFHFYNVAKEGEIVSGWSPRGGWNFVKVPIRSFKEYITPYKRCKYNEKCDYGYKPESPYEASTVFLIGIILADKNPDTSSPEALATWLENNYIKFN